MRRREFLGVLGGAAIVPLAAPAQERVRRVGIIVPAASDDAVFQARVGAFHQALALLGWIVGRNVRIDTRWATANATDIRRHASELAALAPDVILAHGATVAPLLQATRTVPVVFPVVADPVGAGLVDSLARPGGNVTGFMTTEYSLSGKWLELLKEFAPRMTRAAVSVVLIKQRIGSRADDVNDGSFGVKRHASGKKPAPKCLLTLVANERLRTKSALTPKADFDRQVCQ
jgi:putative ABC transport system substrate-binding protein